MLRRFNKKGQTMGYIVKIVLAVIVIVVSVYLVNKYVISAEETIDGVCPGTCKKSCNLLAGDVQKSSTCKTQEGDEIIENKKLKCCVNLKDKPKDDDSGSGGGTITIPDGDVIEVRLNDDTATRVGLDMPVILMELQKEYKLSVWGFGPKGKTCEVKFLDKDGNTPSTGFLSGKNIKQDCVDSKIKTNAYSPDRKNVVVIDALTPKGGEVGNYKVNLYLYDKDGTAVASYPIPIKVTEAIPLADDFCQYKSCAEVIHTSCLQKVPNCPKLSCRLELGQIDTNTGIKAPDKCVKFVSAS